MNPDKPPASAMAPGEFTDAMVRIALIGLIAFLCFRIFNPFLGLMLWALVLAVTLYPLHQRLAGLLGGKQRRASVVIVLVAVLLIGVPLVMLGESFVAHIQNLKATYDSGQVAVPPPADSVADWPIIGERVFEAWDAAARNTTEFIAENRLAIEAAGQRVVSAAAGTAASVLMFLGAFIVAGVMMAWGESGSAAMQRIMARLAGPENGVALHRLSTLTVRSVAAGVVGVAFIQALILGVGFLFAGIPAAGVLALIVLVLGILQLPALLVSLPAVAYLWVAGDASTVSNVIWTVYLLIGGAADNVLKPLLLGRGVDAPMPVILIGALGGMVAAGIVGLFIGAVLLAVGYQVFMDWVGDGGLPEVAATTADSRDASSPPPAG